MEPVARFWSYVEKTDSCWIYTGGVNGRGYGQFFWHGKDVYAHRFSYELAFGTIPDGVKIVQICRVKRCVRPEHLLRQQDGDDQARFWRYVEKTDSCWIYTGSVNGRGYAQFWRDGKNVYAHRYSYELVFGTISDGTKIVQTCRVRRCVRPDHLRADPGAGCLSPGGYRLTAAQLNDISKAHRDD